MSEIVWPERFLPGTTDNYVSNETIVAGLRAADVWPWLNDTAAWPACYGNVSDIRFHDGSGPGCAMVPVSASRPSASPWRRR